MKKPSPYNADFLELLKKDKPNQVEEPAAVYQKEDPTAREDIRHTFVMRKDLLEKIRDYAYMQHLNGKYYYGQRDVLEEILDQFFQGKALVPRPEFIRQKEQERVNRIKKGVKKSS